MVAAACAQRVGKVYDQYLSFIALEAGLFSLGLRDTYLQLNDPAARDTQISVRCPAHAGRRRWPRARHARSRVFGLGLAATCTCSARVHWVSSPRGGWHADKQDRGRAAADECAGCSLHVHNNALFHFLVLFACWRPEPAPAPRERRGRRRAQAASQAVVEGLLSALITLGIVPIIRCPKARPARVSRRRCSHLPPAAAAHAALPSAPASICHARSEARPDGTPP